MTFFHWWSGSAAVVALLLYPLSARATAPENFFAALDAATVVSICQVEQAERPPQSPLVIFHVRSSEMLKGAGPAAGSSLPVVQELVFPSDAPAASKGANGLCILQAMPRYSAYRAVLTAGPYYRFASRQSPILDPSVAPVAKQWLALSQLPSDERAVKRAQFLLDHAGDARLGKDALTELGTIAELGALLGRTGYDRIGVILRDAHVSLDHRRQLLALLVDHRVTAAVPMLQSIQVADLAPFLHQTIAALGGSVPMAQLYADLKADAGEQRVAAAGALATVAARSEDAQIRHEAITTLAKLAEQDGSSAVRTAAVEQLGNMGGDALPAIEPLLNQHDTHVVYAAGRALGAIGSPAATRTLAQQFQQGSYDAQVAAVFGLREIATPQAMQVLADMKANPPDPRLPRVIDFATGKEPGHN